MTTAEYLAIQARLNPRTDAPAGEGCADESKLHDAIIAECRARGWWYCHSRMDRRTTTALGVCDFIIAAQGKTYYVEAKAKGKKLTREQAGVIHWLQNLGHTAGVVYSLAEFLALIAPNNDLIDPPVT